MINQPVVNELLGQVKLPEKTAPAKGEAPDQILFGDVAIPVALQDVQKPAAKNGEIFALIQQNKQGDADTVQTAAPNAPQTTNKSIAGIVLNALGGPTIPVLAGQGRNLTGLVSPIPEIPGAEVIKPAAVTTPGLIKPVLPELNPTGKDVPAAKELTPTPPVALKNNGAPQALLQTIAQKPTSLSGSISVNTAPVAGGTIENIIGDAAPLKPTPVTGIIPPANSIDKLPENLENIVLLNTPKTLDKKVAAKERVNANPRRVQQNLRNKIIDIIRSKAGTVRAAVPQPDNILIKKPQINTNSQPSAPPADARPQSLSGNNNPPALNMADYFEPKKITTDFTSRVVNIPDNAELKAELKTQSQHLTQTNNINAKTLNSQRYAYIEKISQAILQLSNTTARVTNFSIESSRIGKMTIQFTQQSRGDHVTIVVDNNISKDFIDRLLPTIQDNLSQKGFELSSMDVQINQRNDKEAFMQQSKSGSRMNHGNSAMNNDDILQSLIPEIPVRDYGYNTLEVIA